VLAAFDEQLRRGLVAGPGARVDAEERLTRTVGTDGSAGSPRCRYAGFRE
jgi:hypothetical protein